MKMYYTELNPTTVELLKSLSTDFKEGPLYGGFHYTAKFKNGYGISIIKHENSYGHEDDMWEIAVLKGDDLCYDTSITDNVIGWLTEYEVVSYALRIEALDPTS
jgi:predicted nicotinamide N-methyase